MQIVPEYQPRSTYVPRTHPESSECSTCDALLKKVNQARLHALLATVWAQLQEKHSDAHSLKEAAGEHLEGAFQELESHWREIHRMRC